MHCRALALLLDFKKTWSLLQHKTLLSSNSWGFKKSNCPWARTSALLAAPPTLGIETAAHKYVVWEPEGHLRVQPLHLTDDYHYPELVCIMKSKDAFVVGIWESRGPAALSIPQPYGLRTSGSPCTHGFACKLAVYVACVSAVFSLTEINHFLQLGQMKNGWHTY